MHTRSWVLVFMCVNLFMYLYARHRHRLLNMRLFMIGYFFFNASVYFISDSSCLYDKNDSNGFAALS